jgi:type IV secretion system protein VirB9
MDPRRQLIAALLLAALASTPTLALAGAQSAKSPATLLEANRAARAPSSADRYVGGVKTFAWAPGRIYTVTTAPFRVTTLTLEPGETVTAKAAGDTVRWQIGEAISGEGAELRTHLMIKPLKAGLATNMAVTTNRRVYQLDLRSTAGDYNAAVAWAFGLPGADPTANGPGRPGLQTADRIDPDQVRGRYRVEAGRRRPVWTPTGVFDDGRRTFIAFPGALSTGDAPVLFVINEAGEPELVNWRQRGDLYVVDRLFQRAELRLGTKKPTVVRIVRHSGAAR